MSRFFFIEMGSHKLFLSRLAWNLNPLNLSLPTSLDYRYEPLAPNFQVYILIFIKILSWVWWYMPVIPALRRWRQEEAKFKTSLGYIGRSSLKPKPKPKKQK
jgi:hypothetical protein